jgi:hypothetical protein
MSVNWKNGKNGESSVVVSKGLPSETRFTIPAIVGSAAEIADFLENCELPIKAKGGKRSEGGHEGLGGVGWQNRAQFDGAELARAVRSQANIAPKPKKDKAPAAAPAAA